MGDKLANLQPLLLAFGGALATTWILTPLIARVAERLGVVDLPGGRHVHERPTPRLGGVALALGLLVGASLFGLVAGFDAFVVVLSKTELIAFLLPCLMVFLIGLVDDIRGLTPGPRIAAEAIAAGFLVQSGYVIDNVANPFGPPLELGLFVYPVTIAWFVGVTNAFNLVDGLDGLLGSVAIPALLGCAAVAALGDRGASGMLAMAAAGATCGFLFWNWHPARVFMGDSGSLLIGLCVAALSLKVARNQNGTLSFHVPLLLCGLPIAETLLTLARRHVRGQPYLSGDQSHIHHVLVRKGLTIRAAVLSLAGVSGLFAATAVASRNWRDNALLATCVALLTLAGLGLRWLGYLELRVLAHGVGHLLRGRSRLSDLVALATVGETVASATTLDDLRARLQAAIPSGPFDFIALEFAHATSVGLSCVVECNNAAAAQFVAGRKERDDRTLWLFSSGMSPMPVATGSVTYCIPLLNGDGRLMGHLSCQRRLHSGDGDARAISRYIAAPLTATLIRLSPGLALVSDGPRA